MNNFEFVSRIDLSVGPGGSGGYFPVVLDGDPVCFKAEFEE